MPRILKKSKGKSLGIPYKSIGNPLFLALRLLGLRLLGLKFLGLRVLGFRLLGLRLPYKYH